MDSPPIVVARFYEHLDRREKTGVSFFGPDAEAMFARVEPVLRRLPRH